MRQDELLDQFMSKLKQRHGTCKQVRATERETLDEYQILEPGTPVILSAEAPL